MVDGKTDSNLREIRLCQGIANKGRNIEVYCKQPEKVRTEAIATVEVPAYLFRVFMITTFKQNTEIKPGGKND